MPGAAFVYGTLMAPEVVTTLISRMPPHKPATITGYSRQCVKGQVFPAIVPHTGGSVSGLVLLNLSPKELHVLDVYESEEYERVSVSPILQDGSSVEADVYVWKDSYRDLLLDKAWDYDTWRQQHLHEWVTDMVPAVPHPSGTFKESAALD